MSNSTDSSDTATMARALVGGMMIEHDHLLPLVKALRTPRESLPIADDVESGRTVETGLTTQETILCIPTIASVEPRTVRRRLPGPELSVRKRVP